MDVMEETISNFKFADLEDGRRRRNKMMIRLKQADGERGLNLNANVKRIHIYTYHLHFVGRAPLYNLVNTM